MSKPLPRTPRVLICANFVYVEDYPCHILKHQYVRAVVDFCHATPFMVPAVGDQFQLEQHLDFIDGILLTGSPAHVAPHHYGHDRHFEECFLDEPRDSTALPMIKTAIKHNIPLFSICRGFQELNIACGGTLHQYVHTLDGKHDHRQKDHLSVTERFTAHTHAVDIKAGGLFAGAGLPTQMTVNSLHTQGIDKLGDNLRIEAVSDDGLIEGISHTGCDFVVGTQWHPEGDILTNPHSQKLFAAFAKHLQ
jgi:putative glutamine amidotransferase